ncbi:hypothetical protein B8W72_17295 [Pseudomonas putida]|uniref:Uncharacterized protein n=1 Tax=Pseudomonas putida TaxID=303 RepID=A0A1Y3L1P2_PSEPU|nr:RICIN domain-containing protein [Pseudomonas putida]OUM30531.1 hypothetical protein B8W72_17295 [Pseudomonas putida]
MKLGKWKCALLLQMFAMLSACSTGSYDFPAGPVDAALFFQGPQADRQALQALTSKPGTYPSLSALLAAPSTQGAWLVGIKPALVDAENSELAVKLPEEGVVRFNLKRSSDVAGMSGWIGDLPSDRKQRFPSPDEVNFDPFNWISLVRDGDQVVGDIHFKGQLYRLEPIGAGQHVLIKVDESKMAPEGDPILASNPSWVGRTGKSAPSAHSTIRVMFVTTNERRTHSPQYRAELVQALQNANQYLINTRVAITYELAGLFDPNYSESGKNQWAMLQEMANTNSALGRMIAPERERSGADLVSLYNTESSICGNAYGWSKKETGFSTISCTVAVAHELGHNLGGGHGLEGNDPEKSYNHGYRHYSPNFHTIQVTSHGAVPYFSNPRLTYQGVAMGTFQNHDIARQFDEYRHVIENFYPPMPNVLNNKGRFEQGAPNTCLGAFAGINIQFVRCSASVNELWRIEPWGGAGTSRIVANDGKCMAQVNNEVKLATCPADVKDDFRWTVTALPDNTSKIQSYNRDLCLGSQLSLRPAPELLACDNSTHQRWMETATAQ